MEKKKKRFKLKYLRSNPYGTPRSGYWSFVNKIKGGYEVLSDPMSCKDYIHEGLANKINNRYRFTSAGTDQKAPINMKQFQIVMFFTGTDEKFKANLYSVKKYINSLEKKANIKQTSILEVDADRVNLRAFILTADKAYIESPALHHALVAMMRTLHHANTRITKNNITDILQSLHYKDSNILHFMLKHKVYDIFLNNHARIAKLKLTDVYPLEVDNISSHGGKVTSYHSGFGMVAMCSRRIASKTYSKVVNEILDENNVPNF